MAPLFPSIERSSLVISGHEVLFDLADWRVLQGYNWRITLRGNTFYATACVGKSIDIDMHCLLIPSVAHPLKRDHINRNGLDNRRMNLRVVTTSENALNSSYKASGVSLRRSDRRWTASATRNNKRRSKTGFRSKIEASIWYCVLAGSLC